MSILWSFGAFIAGAVAVSMGRRLLDNVHQSYRREMEREEKSKVSGLLGSYRRGL